MPKRINFFTGIIDTWYEQGMSNVLLVIIRDKKNKKESIYDRQTVIQKGDHLKVFSKDKKVLFDDVITFDPWLGAPRGWKRDKWIKLFSRGEGKELMAELKKNHNQKPKKVETFNIIIQAEVESTVILKDKAIVTSPEMGWVELLKAIERGEVKVKINRANYK